MCQIIEKYKKKEETQIKIKKDKNIKNNFTKI